MMLEHAHSTIIARRLSGVFAAAAIVATSCRSMPAALSAVSRASRSKDGQGLIYGLLLTVQE